MHKLAGPQQLWLRQQTAGPPHAAERVRGTELAFLNKELHNQMIFYVILSKQLSDKRKNLHVPINLKSHYKLNDEIGQDFFKIAGPRPVRPPCMIPLTSTHRICVLCTLPEHDSGWVWLSGVGGGSGAWVGGLRWDGPKIKQEPTILDRQWITYKCVLCHGT